MRSIFVLLEDLVSAEFGPRDLAAIRAEANGRAERAGGAAGPAGQVMHYIDAIAEVRRRDVDEVYQFVAMTLAPIVVQEYGAELREHSSARTMLMHLTRLAPPVLAALVPGIPEAHFDVELVNQQTLRIRFDGPAVMLSAFEGVATGLAQHYQERATTTRVSPPSYAPQQRILEVQIGSERREVKGPPRPVGRERRRILGL